MRGMTTQEAATGASERITAEVTAWPGVSAAFGRRGEWAFKVGQREIGHLHGDHVAHFGFPKDVFDELFAAGRIVHHPVFPDRRGPGARRIEDDADVDDVIALLREQYDRAIQRSPAGSGGSPAAR
jgi:luciferase-like monooxygenase